MKHHKPKPLPAFLEQTIHGFIYRLQWLKGALMEMAQQAAAGHRPNFTAICDEEYECNAQSIRQMKHHLGDVTSDTTALHEKLESYEKNLKDTVLSAKNAYRKILSEFAKP